MGPNPLPPPAFDGQGPTIDVRSMLVVLMKYQDEPDSVAGCEQDEFEKKAFTNDDSWAELIYKGSHHVTKFPQEQYQWVEVTVPGSVPRDSSTCSGLTTMVQEFADGATSLGHDPRQFHNVMYLTPPGWCDKASYAQAQVLCSNTIAGGRHNVGTACMSWYYQSSATSSHAACSSFAVAHELGHNFGYLHTGADAAEYGDPTSIMGARYQNGADFTAFDKLHGGWLSEQDVLSNAQDATLAGRRITLQSVTDGDANYGMATAG